MSTINYCAKLDMLVSDKFEHLEQGKRVCAEYIWIGGSGQDLRCKTRTFDEPIKDVSELPIWNFDGSSTGQAPGHDSEVLLRPCSIFRDPFRGGDNILVLCDCIKPDGTPVESNTRDHAAKVFEKVKSEEWWFGIEQEYTLFNPDKVTPLGWPVGGYPGPQGPYYCSVGAEKNFGRPVMEAHYKACLYAGVKIAGTNAEVMPGQWEYQVGPSTGIDAGDHMWVARYIMERVTELYGIIISIDPKPIPGDWNGAGCHTNCSTKAMREAGGFKAIIDAINKMEKRHREHISVYGQGNERRLTGLHETSSIDEFSYGVANRGCSIRIPRQTEKDQRGYFEDRRPASNMDPYLVTARIAETCTNVVQNSTQC